MLELFIGFGRKYLFEIIAVVCFVAAAGLVVYKAQNWCNHACRTAKVELTEVQASLATCQTDKAKEMSFYLEQVAQWQKQVAAQLAAIEEAKKNKEEIVEKNRRSFDQIFKEKKKNEAQSKERVVAEIRPTDVVTAPTALVREYNAAVAASAGLATGNSGSEVGVPQGAPGTLGEIGTYDAVAVAEALLANLYKYNQLALRCNTLVDIVKELEAKNGTTSVGGPAGTPEANGGDVLDGAARAQVF